MILVLDYLSNMVLNVLNTNYNIMNLNKWYKFINEQQQVQQPAQTSTEQPEEKVVDQYITDEIAVFQLIVKAEFEKGSNVLLTQFKDIIRGIISVTTVSAQDISDLSLKYDRRYLNIKFELERGENIDEYLNKVLVPQLRKIKGMRILHYSKVERVR